MARTAANRAERSRQDARQQLVDLMPVAEQRFELAGIPTAALIGGSGPPLVLLHGPGEHAPKWFRIVPELVKAHTVVAPDLPAHGASGAGSGELDAQKVLAWLDALIARTCSTKPVLVGQIIGGAIAARYAAGHPDRISQLVLSDALGLAAFQPAPEFGAALQAFLGKPDEATHDHMWAHCAYDLERLRTQLGETWVALKAYNLDRAVTPELKAPQMALMQQFGFPAIEDSELKRIAVPTTLIWGRNDLATPVAVAEAASKRYGWPLHVVDDCGDDPPMEQPQAFLEALERGLSGPAARKV